MAFITARALREWRAGMCLTVAGAAREMGMAAATYKKMEAGVLMAESRADRTSRIKGRRATAEEALQCRAARRPSTIDAGALRAWRRENNMTQDEVAHAWQISARTYKRYEKVDENIPNWVADIIVGRAEIDAAKAGRPFVIRQGLYTWKPLSRDACIDYGIPVGWSVAAKPSNNTPARTEIGADGFGVDVPDYLKNI